MPHLSPTVAFLCCVTLVAAAANGQQGDPTTEWIRANAIRLSTSEAGRGFADMQPLKKVIGNARIVSLGEATHGTREFFQLKHRMLEFLATEMGFTMFSIEANMPEAYRLNDYVLNGTGDPAELLRGMYFWTWNTEEVLEMIRWMRTFNASGRGRVQFTGFDMQTHSVALDNVQQFIRRYDTAYVATLRDASGRIPTGQVATTPGFGVATGTFPVARAAGKSIRFSGYIKTEGVTTGYAGLWWRVDGAPGTPSLAFDNMSTRGANGTADWKPFSIELRVDPSARNINFGMLMPGNGTAWFDDLTIDVDGQPFTDTNQFDLNFDSGSLRGFFSGGNGYRVGFDTTVKRSGRQSLRMTRVAEPAPPVDRAAIVADWNNALTRLEQQRASYRTLGASDRDVDWAIQNARVVLQAVQMRLGLVSRDRSMALNVKWILDHNPNEKIVLWAHNGHVARGKMMLQSSMGEELHAMYGDQMVVLGFGFNRGSFQAVGARGGGLQNFTVSSAPTGSFDALLAAPGIPFFALDLRNAPPALLAPLASRQIGALFSNETESNYVSRVSVPAAFDAILFVENTTAARPNVRR